MTRSSGLSPRFIDMKISLGKGLSAATALGTLNLRKCTQHFCRQDLLIAFLNGMDVYAQATPLILIIDRIGLASVQLRP